MAFGTKILDKPLRKKETGLENSGNFLTIGSIFIFVFENTIFKIKMDTSQIIDVCLIYAFIVIGAITESQELIDHALENEKKGAINMCTALEELKKEGVQEGLQEGLQKGLKKV